MRSQRSFKTATKENQARHITSLSKTIRGMFAKRNPSEWNDRSKHSPNHHHHLEHHSVQVDIDGFYQKFFRNRQNLGERSHAAFHAYHSLPGYRAHKPTNRETLFQKCVFRTPEGLKRDDSSKSRD
ncbi:hypothetical protein AVEN_194175-1 [Araneus ventricosus]|uniref:Uncharacterized protein n=1 Tax=Araneus ventricosus TaxID=182803 RepID=A0A4Y2FRG7_ARAVE|nr:hypothetical protein AVEN_194175-1 [Araneus ventricosus]